MIRTIFAAALLALATACSKSPEAAKQESYQKEIETEIFTKFIDNGPLTDGRPVLFVVVKTTPDDQNALRCTYRLAPNEKTTSPMTVFRVSETEPHFHPLSPREARDLLTEARSHGAEASRIAELLGKHAVKLYDPFPRDETTLQRHFIFDECAA